MDAILFSVNLSMVRVDDARRHLDEHSELYWEVGYRIGRNNFVYPILGYIMMIKPALASGFVGGRMTLQQRPG